VSESFSVLLGTSVQHVPDSASCNDNDARVDFALRNKLELCKQLCQVVQAWIACQVIQSRMDGLGRMFTSCQ